jgi:hypothetical protein
VAGAKISGSQRPRAATAQAMNADQRQLLSLLAQPPLRLTVQQAAWVLHCQPHDIPVLLRAKLLKPLGAPTAKGTKYFGTREILELGQDRTWLARAGRLPGRPTPAGASLA